MVLINKHNKAILGHCFTCSLVKNKFINHYDIFKYKFCHVDALRIVRDSS